MFTKILSLLQKIGKKQQQQHSSESDPKTFDEAGPSGRKELPSRQRVRVNYNVDDDNGDVDDSGDEKMDDLFVVPKKKRNKKVIESDSDEDYEMQLSSD